MKVAMVRRFFGPVLAVTLLAAAGPLQAQSPGDGTGKTQGSGTGLGESQPPGKDLSLDAGWHVYAFERDGVRYLQVNDLSGTVRAVVGFVGDTFWTLPLGTDADRVSTSQQPLPVSPDAAWKVVYAASDAEVKVYADAGSVVWAVGRPNAGAQ